MNVSRRIGGTAARTRLALAAVGRQRPVEVAGLAPLTLTYSESNEVPPSPSASRITSAAAVSTRPPLARGSASRWPRAVQPSPPQRLVGVDVADAGHQGLVQQRTFQPGAPCRRTVRPPRQRSNTGSNGSRAMCATGTGSVRRPRPSTATGHRTCAGRRSAAQRRRRRTESRTRKCSARRVTAGISPCRIWPLMPRWASNACSPSASGSHRYLPRRPGRRSCRPSQPGDRSPAPGKVATYRARMVHLDRGDGAPGDVLRRARAGRPRPRAAPACCAPRRRSFSAWPARPASARRPRRPAARLPSWSGRHRCRHCRRSHAVAVNSLSWSGPAR